MIGDAGSVSNGSRTLTSLKSAEVYEPVDGLFQDAKRGLCSAVSGNAVTMPPVFVETLVLKERCGVQRGSVARVATEQCTYAKVCIKTHLALNTHSMTMLSNPSRRQVCLIAASDIHRDLA